jgi:hypothetical protein
MSDLGNTRADRLAGAIARADSRREATAARFAAMDAKRDDAARIEALRAALAAVRERLAIIERKRPRDVAGASGQTSADLERQAARFRVKESALLARIAAIEDAPAAPIEQSGAIEDAAATIAALTGDATVTAIEAGAVIEWCREFARDCEWREDAESIEALPTNAMLAASNRAIDGGLAFVLADVRRLALSAEVDSALWLSSRRPLADANVCHHCGARDGMGATVRPRGARGLATCLKAACQASAMQAAPIEAPTFTAIYRAPLAPASDRSIYEQSIDAPDIAAALTIATSEATARGLVVVGIAAGAPDGFGAAILADGIEASC